MYRIKSKQKIEIFTGHYRESIYYVQYKFKWFGWITITKPFDSAEQAKEHIRLKLEVISKGEI